MFILIKNIDRRTDTVEFFATKSEAVAEMQSALAEMLNIVPSELSTVVAEHGNDTPDLGLEPMYAWTEKYGTNYSWTVVETPDNPLTIPQRSDIDRQLENLWQQFGDIPMDPETECIEEPFLDFPAGTFREEVWHWFDERYSKGIYNLMYQGGEDRTQDITKLLYLSDQCFECETHDCAYNHNGVCCYALVHEKMPEITDENGCVSGVIDAFGENQDSGVVTATFVSEWDDGSIFATACKVDLDTGSVFDIDQVDAGEVNRVVENEYVLINGVRHDVMADEHNQYNLV